LPAGPTLTAHRIGAIRLQRLELLRFRNISQLDLAIEAPRLLVLGRNGEGKSNLLEAVELLGSLRSHRASHDRELIQHQEASAKLSCTTACGDSLVLELRRSGGRQALRNGKVLERHHDLQGNLRCVGFSALDLDLVRGEPALRRHWLDRVVLQLEPLYSELLSRYGRLLRQRSQLLRQPPHDDAGSSALLDAFDSQMALVGTRLHRRRQRALQRLAPLASNWHDRLSGGRERLELQYRSGSVPPAAGDDDSEAAWCETLADQLRAQRPNELRLGQCGVGPHRDEIALQLQGDAARRFGSAGQQRTLVLALKLAELELVHQVVGEPPVLLLDDVLAELDPGRQQLLLEAVGEGHQCLVSATHLQAFSGGWCQSSQVVTMQAGTLQRQGAGND